ncbi:MAG: PEP-CTERM sorting domain-containing protein [Phycisphaerales bacterium]|nr:PEP-CTERM sorting domain-containing protein [Phycisphaerales bacterium]
MGRDAELIATTPEPSTLTLLALGGLAILRRRHKQWQQIDTQCAAGLD